MVCRRWGGSLDKLGFSDSGMLVTSLLPAACMLRFHLACHESQDVCAYNSQQTAAEHSWCSEVVDNLYHARQAAGGDLTLTCVKWLSTYAQYICSVHMLSTYVQYMYIAVQLAGTACSIPENHVLACCTCVGDYRDAH